MPITIKSNAFKYKDPDTGNYVGIDTLAETTTSTQVAAINAAGAAVIQSIPADYTSLASAVTDIDKFNDYVISVEYNTVNSLNNGATVSGDVLTIPANSTGNNSYIGYRINAPASLDILKGKMMFFELAFDVSDSIEDNVEAFVSTGSGVTTTVKSFNAATGNLKVLVEWASDASSNYIVTGVRKSTGSALTSATTVTLSSLVVRYSYLSEIINNELSEEINYVGNGFAAPLNYDSVVSSLKNGATASADNLTITIPSNSTGNATYFGGRFLQSINILRGKQFHVIIEYTISDPSFLINVNPIAVGDGITTEKTIIDNNNGIAHVYGKMASDATATLVVFPIGVSNNTAVSSNVTISITSEKVYYYTKTVADTLAFNKNYNGGKLSALGHSMVQQGRWQNAFIAQTRMSSYTNVAIYGGILAQHYTDVSNIATDSDVIVVWYDTNDWANNITLGTITDSTTSPTTYCGALKYVCEWIAENVPTARVILVSSPKRFDSQFVTVNNLGYQENNNGDTLEDFSNAIKAIADLYSYTFCDLFHESGINSGNYATYLDSDGLHPNYYGGWRIAQILASKIGS